MLTSLVADEQSTRPPGQDLHDLDHRIFVDMGTWARRRFHTESARLYDDYPIEFGERAPEPGERKGR